MKPYLILMGFALFMFACDGPTDRKQGFEVHGIDVSHYQKKVDWKRVASQGIDFAFIKATEGETYKDSFFCENWAGMKAAGVKRGAYHFFRPTLSAEAQAINFIEMADLRNGDFVPVLDVEVIDGVSPEKFLQQMDEWLLIVEDHFKVKPIIYTYQNFYNKHLAGHYEGYPVWIARYSSWRKPRLRANQDWQFWQYGNKGQLAGINGPVDFNVFNGTKNDLDSFSIVRPEPLFNPPPSSSDDLMVVSP